nr:hypothetical protein [Tanacetum cinerariifolium]
MILQSFLLLRKSILFSVSSPVNSLFSNQFRPENETDCHHENEIRLSQRLLYDNSSPRPPKEFNSGYSNAEIESFSPSPIPNEDSNSFMEEIDLFLTLDDPMPPSIEDDEDSDGDIIFERLLHDDPVPLPDIFDFSYKFRIFLPFFTYPRLLYDNSSPRPSEEFNSKNSNADIESFSPSPILNEDSDSIMEEINLFLTPDDPMPPSIEDDEDSEGDILFLERLFHDDPIPLPHTLDFSYEVRIFLPFFTYPVTSPVLLSSGSEDKIFDPGITVNRFYSF